MTELTHARLCALLRYLPETGDFVWLVKRNEQILQGHLAGRWHNKGYREITVDRKTYFAHRLAWFYVYGEWPVGEVDHRDTNKGNNAIANLRLASRSLNQGNVKIRRDNTSGLKGVYWSRTRKKFVAQIRRAGFTKNLGGFDTAEEAHTAYCEAAREYFGEFARAG